MALRSAPRGPSGALSALLVVGSGGPIVADRSAGQICRTTLEREGLLDRVDVYQDGRWRCIAGDSGPAPDG